MPQSQNNLRTCIRTTNDALIHYLCIDYDYSSQNVAAISMYRSDMVKHFPHLSTIVCGP